MKRPILKTALSVSLIFSLLFLISCEKDNPGGGGGGGGDPQPATCSTYGTFTKVICGTSVYDNYWILTDDGKFLQPCETDVTTRCPLNITEGTRIKFGYKKISAGHGCLDEVINCAAIDPRLNQSNKIRVKVTCLEIIEQPAQCQFIGTILEHPTCSVKYIQMDDGSQFEPVNQGVFNGFSADEKVLFSYNPVLTFQMTCSGAAAVELTCITRMGCPPPPPVDCRPLVIGDDPRTLPANFLINVLDAYIDGNCLKLKVGFSGCDASTDRISLTWDGIFDGDANLALVDDAPQMCNAYFTQEVSYDLSALKAQDQGNINIHIAGWEGSLIY
jgi:hypothetical protein